MPGSFHIWEMHCEHPREFDPHDADELASDPDLRYFKTLVGALDLALGEHRATVLLTWHLDRFDERFRDAVVILVNDEQYQVPSYAGLVRAIFKTGGVRPNPLTATLSLAPAIAWRQALRDVRNVARSGRRRLATRQTRGAPVHPIPLGYLRLADLEPVPFADRASDVMFAGSIESERGITVRPRLAARRAMARAVADLESTHPEIIVDCTRGGPFANPASMLDPLEYSRRLMNARIVLCPRGNFDETYRLTEAARCGCVAICEPLPRRWYYEEAPVVVLPRWSGLSDAVEALLADDAALAERGARMRAWWETQLSERAVASEIAACLARPSADRTREGVA